MRHTRETSNEPLLRGLFRLKACTYCVCMPSLPLALRDSVGFLKDGAPNNSWPQLEATADFEFIPLDKFSAFNDINSLYADKAVYGKGSFAGLHVISDRKGRSMRDELVVVGSSSHTLSAHTDTPHTRRLPHTLRRVHCVCCVLQVGTADGVTFSAHGGGKWLDKETGKFALGNGMVGTILKNEITFEGGAVWVKVTPGALAPRHLCAPKKIERPIPQEVIDFHMMA